MANRFGKNFRLYDEEAEREEGEEEFRLPQLPPGKRDTRNLFDSRVVASWYKRYAPYLPTIEQFHNQPFPEIERTDEEIAMRHIHGDRWRTTMPRSDERPDVIKRQAVLQYQNLRERQEKRLQREKIVNVDPYAMDIQEVPNVETILKTRKEKLPKLNLHKKKEELTPKDIAVMKDVLAYWTKITAKSRRINHLEMRYFRGWTVQKSKWRVVQTNKARNWARKKYKQLCTDVIREKFSKMIRLVRCMVRFLHICSQMAGHAKGILQLKTTSSFDLTKKPEGKFLFDPSKFKISNSTTLDEQAIYALTIPYFNRTQADVEHLLDSLQILRCFAELPVNTQRFIACAAWFIKVDENKIVIRQCHEATNFYILLSGRVTKNVWEGDPYVFKDNQDEGGFKVLQSFTKDSVFGEEALTKPDSIRDYSIIAGSMDCEVLSISRDDYFECSMMMADEKTLIPDHIAFISYCSFLKDFPITRLRDDAEGNIFMSYFWPGTVVEKSMKESTWVYVVKHGSCRALVELRPSPEMIETHRFKMEIRRLKKMKGSKRKKSSYFSKSISEPSPPTTSESDDEWSKDRRSTVEDVRETYVPLDENIAEENRNIKEKCRTLSRRLEHLRAKEKQKKTAEAAAVWTAKIKSPTLPQIISKASKMSQSPSTNSVSYARRKISFPDVIDDEEDGAVSETGSQTNRKKYLTGTRMSLDNALGIQNSADALRRDSTSSKASKSIEFVDAITRKSSDSANISRRVSSPSGSRRHSASRSSSGTNTSLRRKSMARNAISRMKNSQDKDDEDTGKRKVSSWKLKKHMVKGDDVGFEWIDLLDGTHRPPDEDCSLVSDGAELVMIRKEFVFNVLSVHTRDEDQDMD